MSTTAIEQAKQLIKAQVQSDLSEKLVELRQEHPGLSTEELMALLPADLVGYAQRIETGNWPKPPPIYQFAGRGAKKPLARSLREALKLPAKIEARKPAGEDDGELMLVMAADGEVVGLELVESDHSEKLHKQTQRLIDRTDGPLHRDVAQNLVRDRHPELDDRSSQDEDLEQHQQTIKDEISKLRAKNPKLTFRTAWELLQRTKPGLFEELPKAD
jgi:hypothetical protein